MQFETRDIQGVRIIAISGRLDAHTLAPVSQWLEQTSVIPHARILVNLEATTFIDSTALAALVQARRRCQQAQGTIALCALRRPIFIVFELTRLDSAFTIFVDETQALQTLGME